MDRILIINENTPFREGLKKLIELKFGNLFEIIEMDFKKISRFEMKVPKLIIIDKLNNSITKDYLVSMQQKGSKVILLSLDTNTIENSVELDIIDGYLLKNMQTHELMKVIERIIYQNHVYVHPDVGYIFLQKLRERKLQEI